VPLRFFVERGAPIATRGFENLGQGGLLPRTYSNRYETDTKAGWLTVGIRFAVVGLMTTSDRK